MSASIAAAAGIAGSRCTYVGPVLAAASSSFTPTSSSSYSAAETSFLKEVSDHAKSLVKSLKRRPYLHSVAKLEPVVGVVDEGEGGLKSPHFCQLYDGDEAGKLKRIKVEDKVRKR